MKRTEIIVETERVRVIQRRGLSRLRCDGCLKEVRMLTPNEAAALMNISSRLIYRWIEAGKVHFLEEALTVLICAESLRGNHENH